MVLFKEGLFEFQNKLSPRFSSHSTLYFSRIALMQCVRYVLCVGVHTCVFLTTKSKHGMKNINKGLYIFPKVVFINEKWIFFIYLNGMKSEVPRTCANFKIRFCLLKTACSNSGGWLSVDQLWPTGQTHCPVIFKWLMKQMKSKILWHVKIVWNSNFSVN